jgi:hypothetical protein
MTKLLLASALTLVFFTFSGGVHAVDVKNLDEIPYELQINDPAAVAEVYLEISPDGALTGICKSCEISIGEDEPIPASGDDVLYINNGILEIK